MPLTRIVLADDHALFREALGDLLNAQPTLRVVGHASDGVEAIRLTAVHQPDLLLLDLQMPGSHGPLTIRTVLETAPRTRILLLSAFAEPYEADELLAAGAREFLHKGIRRELLLAAIARTVDGDRHGMLSPPPVATAPHGHAVEPLSRREHEVLVGAAAAMSNRQIAERLAVTEGTIKRHLHNVFRKLGAVSRIDAVNKAVQAALIPAPTVSVRTVPAPTPERPWHQGKGTTAGYGPAGSSRGG
ncbi:response regulator [Streptomyces sp. NPDC001678]|uniref:response regulator n=1 Tax=Streptomyces sp. NPDC001678 TaxID=3364599 RepID=UPI0036C88F3D